jgi:hypothetical protein
MTATTDRPPAPPAGPRAQDLAERVQALRVAADRACITVAAHLEGINGERRDETGRVVREMDPILYGCALAGPPGSVRRAMHILRRQRLAIAAQTLTATEWAWTVTVLAPVSVPRARGLAERAARRAGGG